VQIGQTFAALGRFAMAAFSAENWRPIAANLGEAFVVAFTNAFENLRRLIDATKSWIKGGGFSFDRVGALEGANFQNVPALDRLFDDAAQIRARYEQSVSDATDQHTDALGAATKAATVFGGTAANAAARISATRGVGAASRGSVEAASAIARFQSQSRDTLERQQLAELRGLRTDIRNIDLSIEEYAIP
jgi:hypothetical protein